MLNHFEMIVAGLFFGTWAALSVIVLWRKPEGKIRAWDFCRLIPQWRFFAPTPNMTDFFVVYRDVLANGAVTQWTEIRRIPREWWNAIFFPGKRDRKSEMDAAMQLTRFERGRPMREVSASIPYLAILNRITNMERWVEPAFTQFAVASINVGAENPEMEIFLISNLHRLR